MTWTGHGDPVHPRRGTLIRVDFHPGFQVPEMVKRRLCVVVSPPISARKGLVTVVALSTTAPDPPMPYHSEIDIPIRLPEGWSTRCWVKGDMINAVSFARCDLLQLGKDHTGKRAYLTEPLPSALMDRIERCILAGRGLRS